jgi:hypothetical protein
LNQDETEFVLSAEENRKAKRKEPQRNTYNDSSSEKLWDFSAELSVKNGFDITSGNKKSL